MNTGYRMFWTLIAGCFLAGASARTGSARQHAADDEGVRAVPVLDQSQGARTAGFVPCRINEKGEHCCLHSEPLGRLPEGLTEEQRMAAILEMLRQNEGRIPQTREVCTPAPAISDAEPAGARQQAGAGDERSIGAGAKRIQAMLGGVRFQ